MHFKEFVAASLLLYSGLSNSLYTDVSFLKDFFQAKNVMFTASLCWDKLKLLQLYRENANKMMAISTNTDRFLFNLATNNFFVIDLRECQPSEKLLELVSRRGLFRYPLKYLLLTDEDKLALLLKKIWYFEMFPTSEVIIASFNNTQVKLRQPYKITRNSNLVLEDYGGWNSSRVLIENFKDLPTPKRRLNLQKNLIAVAICVFHNESIQHLTDFRDLKLDYFTKKDYPNVLLLMEFLNASFKIRIFDRYGYYNKETKQWDGMVRDLLDRKSDVSGSSLYFTKERATIVDLIRPLAASSDMFLVKQPSTSFIKNIYLLTFTTKVWYAILVVTGIFLLVLFFVLNWECRNKNKVSNQSKYSISDVSLIALEAVCQQGTTTEPRSYSGRTVTVIFFIAFMFIYVSYSAYIVVLLQSTTKINNLNELLESRIEVGGLQNNYMKIYFESQKGGVLEALYKKKIYPNQYFPLEIGMRKVQLGNFAYHVPLNEAFHYVSANFTNYDTCGLQTLPGYINYQSYVAVPKNSPYKKLFIVGLAHVTQSGLQDRITKRTYMKPKCFHNAGNFQSVRFYDCLFIFQVYVFGCILSVVMLIGEIQLYKYVEGKRRIFQVKQLEMENSED